MQQLQISSDDDTNINITSILSDILTNQGISSTGGLLPLTDVEHDDTKIIIRIETPGVDEKSININFYNNLITVVGEKKKKVLGNADVIRNEIKYGCFERKIRIPISVTRQESVEASYTNGVLQIIINKQSEESNKFSVSILQ